MPLSKFNSLYILNLFITTQ